MSGFRGFLRWLVAGIVLVGVLVFVISNYSWVFAKRIHGHIVSVERVTDPNAFVGGRVTDAQMHSYAILIEGTNGKMYTASSDDPKWQVAQKGYCVEATLYVYPPWNLNKANNYFNARLDELSRTCDGDAAAAVNPAAPVNSALPSAPAALPAAPSGSAAPSAPAGSNDPEAH